MASTIFTIAVQVLTAFVAFKWGALLAQNRCMDKLHRKVRALPDDDHCCKRAVLDVGDDILGISTRKEQLT